MSLEPLLDGARLTLQVGLLAGLCRLAWRAVAAWAPFLPALDRLLEAAVLGVAGVVCLLQAAGFAGGLGVGLALAGLAAVWGLAPRRRRAVPDGALPDAAPPDTPGVEWRALGAGLAPAVLAAAALLLLLGQALARVPVEWDGLSYHLFFPAHYLQEGRILHLEMGRPIDQAAFYPQNAELTYALLMAWVRSDLLVAASMVAWTGLAGLATGRLARDLGASPAAAAVAGALAATLPTILSRAASSYVEPLLIFASVAAVLFARRALEAEAGDRRLVAGALCGLAIGVAAGTKFTALPLLAALGGGLLLGLASRRAGARRLATVGVWALAALLPSAAWFARNALVAGNPIYPAPLFGLPYIDRVDLRWQGSSAWAMRGRLAELDLFGDALFGLPPDRKPSMTLGPFALAALLLAALALVWIAPRIVARLRGREPAPAMALALVPVAIAVGAVAWLATPFWFNIGLFRSLVRTAAPTAALALALGAGVLDRVGAKPVWIAAGGSVAVLLQIARAGIWRGVDAGATALAAALVLLAAVATGALSIPIRGRARRVRALAALGVVLALGAAWRLRESGREAAWLSPSPQKLFARAALAAERERPGATAILFASDLNFEFLYLFQGRRLERRIVRIDPRHVMEAAGAAAAVSATEAAASRAWLAAAQARGVELVVVSRWLAPGNRWPVEASWARELGLPLVWQSEEVEIFRAIGSPATPAEMD